MSSSNSSDQSALNLNQKLGAEKLSTVNQDFLTIALEYQKLKKDLKTLASEKGIDLETSYLILQNIEKKGNRYELIFFLKDLGIFIKIDTDKPIFYSFKEVFNAGLEKARTITGDRKFTKASLPSLVMEELDVIDAASWATAILAFLEYSNQDDESLSSLTTTLQIQAYYGLVQSGISLVQGVIQITEVVTSVASGSNGLISLSATIGDAILETGNLYQGSTKSTLSLMGKTVKNFSNGLTVVTGIFSIALDSAAIYKLDPTDPGYNGAVASLSFNVIGFTLTLTSIFSGTIASVLGFSAPTASIIGSFAGGLTVPVAGLAIGITALVNQLEQNFESCRRLGEFVLDLEESYLNFPSYLHPAVNFANGKVIVKSINLTTKKLELTTPKLPYFGKGSRVDPLKVYNNVPGYVPKTWSENYKNNKGYDLPLNPDFNLLKEVILPVTPEYRMDLEAISLLAGPYNRFDKEIMALPILTGSDELSWNWQIISGHIVGFSLRNPSPIEYYPTIIKVIGSGGDDILSTPSLEDEECEYIRNLVTYEIKKDKGSCLLTVSQYAKYEVTLGNEASLSIYLPTVEDKDLDINYLNCQIKFSGSWVKIEFPEQEKSLDKDKIISIIDKQGKQKKVNFSTESSELILIDSELYKKATNKSIEEELRNGRNIDIIIDSLQTIPIKNALQQQQQQRHAYGFYFRKKNVIQYLNSPGKLPASLGVVKCLPDQVILRQQVFDDFYYYTLNDSGTFKIDFSGQPHSQSLGYLINGQVPAPSKGILKDGCPNCHSGNIQYSDSRRLYVDPLRCSDCNYDFPEYPPNTILHSTFFFPRDIEEIHSSLLEWSRGSEDIYYDYVNLVIEASESNYYAQQQKEKIQQCSQQISQKLKSVEGKEKLELLNQTFWSLRDVNYKGYFREIVKPPIADLLTEAPPTSSIQLSEDDKSNVHNMLLKWARYNMNLMNLPENRILIEYVRLVVNGNPYHKPTQQAIEELSPMVMEELINNDPKTRRLRTLLSIYNAIESLDIRNYIKELLRAPVANLLDIDPASPIIPLLPLDTGRKNEIQHILRLWSRANSYISFLINDLIEAYEQQQIEEHSQISQDISRSLIRGTPNLLNTLRALYARLEKRNEIQYVRDLLGTDLAGLLP